MLKLAKDLSLPLDAVTQTFAILARRGAGKTYTASVMAEEMLAAGQFILWLDPLGVAWGLRSQFPILILGGERGDLPLEHTAGKIVAEFAVSERVPLILDVSLFGENEMRRFVGDFAREFYRTNRDAVHWFVDEADEFAPQSGYNAEAAKCLGAMQNIVRRGRARGIGVTLITQRSAVLSKSVLTQTECLIAMQTTAPHDLKAIDEWVKYHGTPEERDKIMHALPKLQQGEAFVYSPAWLGILQRVKIRKRTTHDSSRTPKPGETKAEPKTFADVDLSVLKGKIAETVERAKADDPKELRRQLADLQKQLRQQPSLVADQAAMHRAVSAAVAERDKHWTGEVSRLERHAKALVGRLQQIGELAAVNGDVAIEVARPKPMESAPQVPRVAPQAPRNGIADPGYISGTSRNKTPAPRNKTATPRNNPDSPLSGPEQRIIDAAAWWETLDVDEPTREQLAIIAGYHSRTKGFLNALGSLRSSGLMDGQRLTDAGRKLAAYPDATIDLQDVHNRIRAVLRPGEQRLFDAVANVGGSIAREPLAELLGYHPRTKSFLNSLGRLRTLGIIDYDQGDIVGTELMYPPSLLNSRRQQ